MAYVSELVDGEAFVQNVLENAFEAIARVPIGRDEDLGIQYSVQVALITLEDEDYGEDAMELCFDIVAIGSENPTYIGDGRDTKDFLVGEERAKVLDVVCTCATGLLESRKPAHVHMTTKFGPTPRKALTKYALLSRSIRSAGYSGGKADGYESLDIWMFVRDE